MNFNAVKTAIRAQFDRMQKSYPLFRGDVSRDDFWDTLPIFVSLGHQPHPPRTDRA